jgi:hypothetical protein
MLGEEAAVAYLRRFLAIHVGRTEETVTKPQSG